MTDNDILISDLNDISEILNYNGYGEWCKIIRKAVKLLKEQEIFLMRMYNRCFVINGCNCNMCLMKDDCERLRGIKK